MALFLPPWYFTQQASNFNPRVAAPSSASPGQALTPGSSNADSAYVNVTFGNLADSGTVTAIEFDVCAVMLEFAGNSGSNVDTSTLIDVHIDRAGGTSYGTWIDDLVHGFNTAPAASQNGAGSRYFFPLWAPAGSSFGVRARTNGTAAAMRFLMTIFGLPSRPDVWRCGQGVESLGIAAATSKGANHTPGNAAWSTWATIGTSTHPYFAYQFGWCGTDNGMLGIGTCWQVGVGSQKLPGSPDFATCHSASEVSSRYGFGYPLFCNLPESSVVQVRGWGSAAGEVNTVAFYGVY